MTEKWIGLPSIGKVAYLWAPRWIRPWLACHPEILTIQAAGPFWMWVYLN